MVLGGGVLSLTHTSGPVQDEARLAVTHKAAQRVQTLAVLTLHLQTALVDVF